MTARTSPTNRIVAPLARRVPTVRTHHGDTVVDHYAWLADRDDPATIRYLEAENAYAADRTAHLAELRETLFEEIRTRTQETDLSVPVRKGGHWYYTRTVEGSQYPIHCRVRVAVGDGAAGATPPSTADGRPLDGEEVLLDENVLAGDGAFFALGAFDVSPDGRLLAYSTDVVGDERYVLRVKNLVTGETLPDTVTGTGYGTAWSADGSTLFYLTLDDAWRPYRVWRHTLGTQAESDALVVEEPDERFWLGVALSRSERYVMISANSRSTSEVRVIDAGTPTGDPRLVAPRRDGIEYSVEHVEGPAGDLFLVLHNDGAVNFALAAARVDDPTRWRPLVEHRDDTRLMDVDAFADHLVLSLRRDGLTRLRLHALPASDGPLDAGAEIGFDEPVHTVWLDANPEYRATRYRLGYTSLVTPTSVYDFDPARRELTLLKRQPVLGGYDPAEYAQRREWAETDDGTRVPISLVYRRDLPRDGSAPCELYGYGSYEISMDPSFSVRRLSLLDRGFVVAVAHVRGGGELGRTWYEHGRLLHKRNTFTDFLACARVLVERGWTSPDRLVARGGSAGGLLMGAVADLAPQLFAGIAAEVPFVDALNTILDPSLPLTVNEWEEWGDPLHNPEVYAYMKAYAPYETVAPRPYPPILAMAGLHDTRVLYHEPAKWVAKLRAVGAADVTLKTEMTAGHGGPSGRYDAWREAAYVTAWMIDVVGAPHGPG